MEQLDQRILAAIEKGHISNLMGSSILSNNIVDRSVVLKELMALGVTVPDPPRPSLPVVSEDAVCALLHTAPECLEPGHRGDVIQWQCAGCVRRMQAGLRAAFRIILRDRVAALQSPGYSGLTWSTGSIGACSLSQAALTGLLAALTGTDA